MATAPSQARMTLSDLPPSLNAGVIENGVPFTERITEALLETGCSVAAKADGENDIVIRAHERADATVCAELRKLASRFPDSVVILVVAQASSGDVRRALQAGAHAVVTEPLIESALIPSIGAALAGQIVIPAGAREGGQPGVLTTREKQILGLVVMGMTNAEIAGKLFLAESTVKSHLSSAFAKLGVSSRK